jgi:hypothetical protein
LLVETYGRLLVESFASDDAFRIIETYGSDQYQLGRYWLKSLICEAGIFFCEGLSFF